MPTLTGAVRVAGSGAVLDDALVRAYRTTLWLGQELKAYAVPDTASPAVARLPAGGYPALDMRTGPTSGADHVLVSAPDAAQGQVWVCSRWRRSTYAVLSDEQLDATARSGPTGFSIDVPGVGLHRVRVAHTGHLDAESARGVPDGSSLDVELAAAPHTVPESGLVNLLHHFAGWYYTPVKEQRTVDGTTRTVRFVPQYPYDIGVQVRLDPGHPEPPTYDDCCSFVEALVVRAWLDAAVPGFTWDRAKHDRAMIVDPAHLFSSVEVLEDSDVADNVDADDVPPPWTAVQGWGRTGHTFFVVDVHPATRRVLTLESNLFFWLNGPGFRMLSPLGRYLGRHFRCPTDGYVYDPDRGDPQHGVPPGTQFRAASRWDLQQGATVPADWTCPGCGTAKDAFLPQCQPPRDWWRSTWLPTWEQVKQRYPQRRMARLRLHQLTWVR